MKIPIVYNFEGKCEQLGIQLRNFNGNVTVKFLIDLATETYSDGIGYLNFWFESNYALIIDLTTNFMFHPFKLFLTFTGLAFCFFTTQCKKNYPTGTLTPISSSISSSKTTTAGTNTNTKDTVLLGLGNGHLVIDGSVTPFKDNQIIKIKAGSYTEIDVKNIHASDGSTITVANSGLVEFVGKFNGMTISDVSNVIISGGGTPGIQKGLYFHDNAYRALIINGKISGLSIQNVLFRNIGDYVIYANNTIVYDGTDNSTYKNLSVLNCTFDNTGGLQFGGNISNGLVTGLVRNLEIGYDTIINSNWGYMVYCGAADTYNLHHNYFTNINATNNNHNGMFLMFGNGRFYNNYVGPHQGNSIRAWNVSFGTKPEDVFIYNNIVLNSRKYSGFEVQTVPGLIIPGKTTFVNSYIFHNTCGNLNLIHDWVSNIVDVYPQLGGTVKIINNLGYNFYPTPPPGVYSTQGVLMENSGNQYYTDAKSAGFDENQLVLLPGSLALNAGIPDSLLITDFYGKIRSASHPSSGAIEN